MQREKTNKIKNRTYSADRMNAKRAQRVHRKCRFIFIWKSQDPNLKHTQKFFGNTMHSKDSFLSFVSKNIFFL